MTILDIDTGAMVTGIIGMLTLALGLVGVVINHAKNMALANQANVNTQQQVDKLEVRVTELESNLFKKLDHIQSDIQDIKVAIARNERK